MPAKRKFHKKRTYRKRRVKKDVARTTKISRIHKELVPAMFFTRLQYAFQAVESVAASNSLDYAFWINSPQGPGNVTGFNIGSTALLSAPGIALDMGGITPATGHALGLTKFMSQTAGSQLYTTCHVLKSHIRVTYTPLAATDSISLSIVPQKDSDSFPISSTLSGMAGPYGKNAVLQFGQPHKDQTLTHFIDCAKFLGVTHQTYMSNPAYAYNSTYGTARLPARVENEGAQLFWVIRRVLLSSGTAFAPLPYRVEINYDVVFQAPVNDDVST